MNAIKQYSTLATDGQIFGVTSALGVTTLTMSGGTIINGLTTIVAGGFATWMYNSDSLKWFRVS